MKIRATVVLAFCLAALTAPQGFADEASHETCGASGTLQQANVTCEYSADETASLYSSGDGHHYSIAPACAVGGDATCADDATCAQGGNPGKWFNVYRDADLIGQTCLTDTQADSLGGLTPARIRREFQHLTWPRSTLSLQPPDGVTLVGFHTNFFTTNTKATTKTVNLLGQRIQIQATPTSYDWQFGDGTHQATSTPGAAYPDLLVTHAYTHTGTVRPAVATTYTGRYRLGTGPWQPIPGTLTLAGPTTRLEIREARGALTGN